MPVTRAGLVDRARMTTDKLPLASFRDSNDKATAAAAAATAARARAQP